MGPLAVENVAVAYVRGRLPEFEPTFGRLLDEDGYWELGSIRTFAELARFVIDEAAEDAAARAFAAVEFVLTERSMREGRDEAVEFLETVAAEGRSTRFEELQAFWGMPTRVDDALPRGPAVGRRLARRLHRGRAARAAGAWMTGG